MSEIQNTRHDDLAEVDDSGMLIGEMLSVLRAHLKLLGIDSWFRFGSRVGDLPAETGDTIFVPEELNKTTFIQTTKNLTRIPFQLGIGLAGMKSAVQ